MTRSRASSHRVIAEDAMKPPLAGLALLLIGAVGCDGHAVRFDPTNEPTADGGGLHVALESFRKDRSSVRVWLALSNPTAASITLAAPPGMPFWAAAVSGDMPAQVRALRRFDPNDYGICAGMGAEDLRGAFAMPARSTVELELILTLPHVLASDHEPWTLMFYPPDHTAIELPLVDRPPAAPAADRHAPRVVEAARSPDPRWVSAAVLARAVGVTRAYELKYWEDQTARLMQGR